MCTEAQATETLAKVAAAKTRGDAFRKEIDSFFYNLTKEEQKAFVAGLRSGLCSTQSAYRISQELEKSANL